jgi:hypothetical protein
MVARVEGESPMMLDKAAGWCRRGVLAGAALALAPVPAAAQEPPSVAEARASLPGRWEGGFEALDDGLASESFAWPIAVSIEDAGDGRTLIERQQFEAMDDDGALIVTVTLLDPDGVTEYASLYIRGSMPEHRTATLSLTGARDATHWTLHAVEDYVRDGEALQARQAMVRDGDSLVITREVDPEGEEPAFGKTRRTLRLVEAAQ